MDNSTISGHIKLIGVLVVSLVLPLAVILLAYLGIISGIGDIIVALAVILSIIYIVGGTIWSFSQDKEDGKLFNN